LSRKEVSIRIGGAAGDGVASTGEIFGKTCARSGLHVYAYNSYQSVIRGGHVWFQIRAGADRVLSVGQNVGILIALNQQTYDAHVGSIESGGGVIFDPKKVKADETKLPKGVRAFPMPALEIAAKYSKNPIMANTVMLGAAMQFIAAPIAKFKSVIEDQFGHKKQEIISQNLEAAQAGWDYAKEHWGRLDYVLGWSDKRRLFMTGNQAIALGALAAGCKFYAFYPMTPASSIGHFLADHGPDNGMVVKQAEDEIAVINMTIGAAYAGARSMCGTSGGGFSLMVEATGFAGITETPIVVVNSQRSGPSTGLPTKTEQGDLNLIMGAGQGDWPRIILAPRNVEEAFHATAEAFNLAERWQTPVFVLSDLLLSEHFETVDGLDLESVAIDRGALITNGSVPTPYLRYELTENGVSPRAIPGMAGAEHIAGSDEHDEDGTLVSDVRAGLADAIEVRIKQMDKRGRKLEGALADFDKPELLGPKDAPVTLVTWGSTQGAAREAMATLAAEGIHVNALEVKNVWPFQTKEVTAILSKARHILVCEGNFTGQFERLLRTETGIVAHASLRKYDGEPFWPENIVAKVKEIVAHEKIPVKGGMH